MPCFNNSVKNTEKAETPIESVVLGAPQSTLGTKGGGPRLAGPLIPASMPGEPHGRRVSSPGCSHGPLVFLVAGTKVMMK